jgi:hypothetical protein
MKGVKKKCNCTVMDAAKLLKVSKTKRQPQVKISVAGIAKSKRISKA